MDDTTKCKEKTQYIGDSDAALQFIGNLVKNFWLLEIFQRFYFYGVKNSNSWKKYSGQKISTYWKTYFFIIF